MADATSTTENTAPKPVAGTWQDTLSKSAVLFDRSAQGRTKASALLWTGAKSAIEEWIGASDTDVNAEGLSADVLEVLGKPRKGDVSKIKTVALAVRNDGLQTADYANLSLAYKEAKRLTTTVQQEKAEDDAADAVIEAIDAPKSTSTEEGAARLLLSKGLDGAVVAILDALNGPSGEHNEAAQRAFMRAVAVEINARVQAAKPKPAPKPAKESKPKPAAKKTAAKKAAAKDGTTKAKPKPGTKASPKATATKAAPKAKPAASAPAEEQADVDDLFEEFEGEVEETPTPAPVSKGRAKPVRR